MSQKKYRTKKKTASTNLFLVEGLSAVSEYMRFAPNMLEVLCCKASNMKELDPGLLSKLQCMPTTTSAWLKENARLPSKAPIWGYVRVDSSNEDDLVDRIEQDKPRLVLALDHIQDPRNLGAIARTAAFMGVKHIVVPKQRQVLLTDVSVATAQGAFCYTDLFVVTNINRTLKQLQNQSYWILGADMGGVSYKHEDFKSPQQSVLVFGSEGKGIAELTRRHCDRFVSIPGAANSLESLNVSVAAGILISHFSTN